MKCYSIKYALLFSAILSATSFAKNCTETDIRNALKAGKSFVYNSQGCTNSGGVIKIKSGIIVNKSGWTFDGNGMAKLQWSGGGKCDDQIPRGDEYTFFGISASNVTIKNVVLDGAPEGIHVSTGSNSVIDNVSFPRICEDAITNGNKKSNSAKNTIVRNSEFNGGKDKAIQINGGSIVIENNEFYNTPRAIGMCSVKADPGKHPAKPCGYKSSIIARGNFFDSCIGGYVLRTAGKDDAKGGTVLADGNHVKNCKKPFQLEEEGYFEAKNNLIEGNCDAAFNFVSSKASALWGCGNRSTCRSIKTGSGSLKVASCTN